MVDFNLYAVISDKKGLTYFVNASAVDFDFSGNYLAIAGSDIR
jgi:hypothetical protein